MEENLNIPKHVAIILDGNGRWAKKKHMPRNYGHAQGSKRVENICEEAYRLGIEYLTVYAFSTENWKRPKEEVDLLMKLLRNYLADCIKTANKNNMVVRVIGDKTGLDADIQEKIAELEEVSKKNSGLKFTIALNYGSKDEMIRGMKALTKDCVEGKIKIEDIIDERVASLVDSAPETLNTFNELAAALGDDPSFATTITNQIGTKANATDLTAHTGNKSNPHGVTLSQLGVTATAAELNYVDGVTSNIQTQIKRSKMGTLKLVLLGVLAGFFIGGGAAASAVVMHTIDNVGIARFIGGIVFTVSVEGFVHNVDGINQARMIGIVILDYLENEVSHTHLHGFHVNVIISCVIIYTEKPVRSLGMPYQGMVSHLHTVLKD